MKYFVTGATGYIGAHVVKHLIEDGHEVHALCRSQKKAAHLPQETNIFLGDVMDKGAVLNGMKDCDYVFHLAAYAEVWARNPGIFFDINVRGTNIVLDSARDSQVKRVVVVSTGGVYGPSYDSIIDESFVRKMDFNNEYEGSKALSESWIKDYVINGLDVVIVSPTRVYGPYLYGPSNSVTMMIEKYVKGSWRFLPGPAKNIGNYVYVGDVVEGMIKALEKGKKGRTYILGGENQSYEDFFNTISKVSGVNKRMFTIPIFISCIFAYVQLISARVFGSHPLITPKWIVKARHNWAVSSKRAEDELGYNITALEEGLRKTINSLIE